MFPAIKTNLYVVRGYLECVFDKCQNCKEVPSPIRRRVMLRRTRNDEATDDHEGPELGDRLQDVIHQSRASSR